LYVGSLFSGIGGLDAGLDAAGLQHAFFCESDEWRRTVLAHHWPGVPIYDDVRDVAAGSEHDTGGVMGQGNTGTAHGDGFTVGLLCGGFPCQDVSVAGRRAGLAGERSGLFFEFARVADALRPRWLLVENVPGLLASNSGRDFGVILGTLTDLGYGVGWRIVDSRYFGVPQRRRRVFIIGAAANGDPAAAAARAGEVLAVGTRCPGHPVTREDKREDVAVASLSGLGTGGPDDNDGQGGRLVTAFHQLQDPIHDEQVSPAIGRKSSGMGVAFSENQRAEVLETTYARQITSGGGKPGQGYPAVRQGMSVRRLTPVECERLQGLTDGWTDHGPDTRRYAALGDAVTAPVGEWIGRRILAASLNGDD